jgi:DNA-binding LytR/AlgR family response regulator
MYDKLKCVVIDDDPFAIQVIKDNCERSQIVEVIATFLSPKKFLEVASGMNYDFCFLDIFMSEMSGLHVAKHIKSRPIIFYTGDESTLKDAINLSPLDILTKPVTNERFDFVIEKVKKHLANQANQRKKYEFFNTAELKGRTKIHLSDIVFITLDTVDYRNKVAYLKDGRKYTLMRYSLIELLQIVPWLLQVNKGELISEEAVLGLTHDRIILDFIKENGKPKEVFLTYKYAKGLKKVITPVCA